MFDKEFYPTPKDIIKKMLKPFYRDGAYYRESLSQLHEMSILEPSAGKGDILDYVCDNTHRNIRENLYCIELNQDLQHTLRGKGYSLIHDDFLTYTGDIYFDLIVMNPPFSEGDKHLLKAWEILHEGDIVCLLNEETIKNPFSKTRKQLASIIEAHGEVEYLGDCFTTAERKTSINVALVRLHKESDADKFDFGTEFKKDNSVPDLNSDVIQNPVARRDAIENLVIQYNATKEAFIDYIKAFQKVRFYGNTIISEYDNLVDMIHNSGKESNPKKMYNYFIRDIKASAWKYLLYKTNIEKLMTHSVMQNFSEFIKQQGNMEFCKENIYSILEMLIGNRETIMQNAVIDVFDIFTKYHEENRVYFEGWKTNEAWRVNRKVILPYWVEWNKWTRSDSDRFSTNVSYWSQYSDIDKVMCYLTGQRIENILTIYQALDRKFSDLGYVGKGPFDNECSSTFFNLRFFKKGTLHLEFKDEKLLERFNLIACKGKNWLPPEQEKKHNGHQQPKASEQQLTLFELELS